MMDRRDLLRSAGKMGLAGALSRLGASTAPIASRPAVRIPSQPADLQAQLAEAIARYKIAGASVAVFRDGKLETAAAGVANLTSGVEMTTDTVMHIGSITKVMNATLVMQLVDEGLVDLDAPLRTYLADFRVADREATERITIQMLLNHTSGIDGELTPRAEPDQERIVDAIDRIARMGQVHVPGADTSYCNPATVLAGYLAQRLLRRSWYHLVMERIFQPAGMAHAVVLPEDALLHRASVGHFLDPATGTQTRTSFAFLPQSYAPAGATAMMSAADLVTFARAHLDDGVAPNGRRILSEASARRMRVKTSSYQGPGVAEYGLGWMLAGNDVVSHGGGGPGILSSLFVHPPSRTAVAVLTNSAHGALLFEPIVGPVLKTVAGADLPGADVAALAQRATDAPVDPAPYAGQYENVAMVVRIIPHDRGVAITSRPKFKIYDTSSLEESPPAPLRPIDDGRFALGAGAVGFVNREPDGRYRHLAMGGRLIRRVS